MSMSVENIIALAKPRPNPWRGVREVCLKGDVHMSMSVEDIVALARAGYTAEQIEAMDGTQPEPQPELQPEPQPEPQQDGMSRTAEKILEELAGMRKAFEASNISNTSQPRNQDVNEVLASIIAPKID